MTDLSIMISFESFQAYYVNLGPTAAEKNPRVYILFSRILAVYPTIEEIAYLIK